MSVTQQKLLVVLSVISLCLHLVLEPQVLVAQLEQGFSSDIY